MMTKCTNMNHNVNGYTMFVHAVFLKESMQKQEILKKDLNLPNDVGQLDGRGIAWLTKHTNKESTFHNIATFHITIPIPYRSNSDMLVSQSHAITYYNMHVHTY